MSRYYDRDGLPIPLMDWAKLFGDVEYKRVVTDDVDGARVSTVWLGLDHAWGDGPPLIFETMTFGYGEGEFCWRYATEDAARFGHAAIVAAVRAGRDLNGFEVVGAD